MASVFNDTLTDTAGDELAAAHTSDSGHSWVKVVGAAGVNIVIASSGTRARGTSTATAIYRATLSATYLDAITTALFYKHSAQGVGGVGVRFATGAYTGYFVIYSVSAGQWQLYRVVAGVASALLASYTEAWTNGTTKTLDVQATGTGGMVVVTADIAGVERIVYADTDAARLTAAGYIGLYLLAGAGTAGQLETRGIHCDTLSADDPTASTSLPLFAGLPARRPVRRHYV